MSLKQKIKNTISGKANGKYFLEFDSVEDYEEMVSNLENLISNKSGSKNEIKKQSSDIDYKKLGDDCINNLMDKNPTGGVKDFIRMSAKFGYEEALKKNKE